MREVGDELSVEWVMEVGCCFFLQAEDGIRDLVRSRGLGDVYKRQALYAGIVSLASYNVHNNRSRSAEWLGIASQDHQRQSQYD